MKDTINKVLEKTLIALLTVMLLSVIWQVFSRFVLRSPSTITDEISSYSLMWLGFVGATYLTGKQMHLAIDLLPKALIAKNQAFYNGIVPFLIFTFSILVLVVGGTRLCALTFQFKQTSASLGIPLGVIYLVIPVSGVLICLFSGALFLKNIRINIENR